MGYNSRTPHILGPSIASTNIPFLEHLVRRFHGRLALTLAAAPADTDCSFSFAGCELAPRQGTVKAGEGKLESDGFVLYLMGWF